MKKFLNGKLVVPIIFILAFLIRLYKIDLQDLWRDEAFTVNASMESVSRIFHIAANDTQPPLHMLILHFWEKVFGFSEFSVRFVSLIFGMIALYFIFLISKKVFLNRKLVILSTSIAAFSPLLVYYSQEARAYSLLLAFFCISFYYFLKIINNGESRVDVILFITSNLLGLYTQNIYVVVTAAFGLIWLLKNVKRRTSNVKLLLTDKYFLNILAAFFIIAIFYLPWLITFIKQYSKITNLGFWLSFAPVKDIFDSLTFFFMSHTGDPKLGLIDGVFGWGIFLIATFTFILGFYYEARELDPEVKSRNHKVYILLYILIILGLIWLISFKTPFFYIRYIMFAAPLILMLSVKGFEVLYHNKRLVNFTNILAIFFIISLAGFQIINNANHDTKAKFSDAIALVNHDYVQGDLVLVPNALSFHAAEYYAKLENSKFKVQIYNPEDNLVYYEGLSNLEEDDFYRGDFSEVRNVWLMQLWDSGVPEHLISAGFSDFSDKYGIQGVEMSQWKR
jgi:4-amino-4-deoxy-L-arabinose transferase-like glycosyltransferase